ncbi:MAG: tRNA lysidine(34) synthetase TilS [Erysipelotrichaceae bacterium]|nr:tRNA lysidine(34) synthetase TilS [Erysipelotrichaceae bacterium]
MKPEFNLDKSGLYLIGVSGGCDSMALLDVAYRQNYRIIVASVNYKKRETADLEEKIVREYCSRRDIPVFFLYPQKQDRENFQKWARDVRYQFYKKLYDENGCDGLLLGHQLDDHLETYLMDKTTGRLSNHAGIAYESEVFGMKVIRPLLSLRKSETRAYCLENGVEFHDDESNYTDDYQRNYIRHHLVEPADEGQIEIWLQEIRQINEKTAEIQSYISTSYDLNAEISLEMFRKESHEVRLILLRSLIRTLIAQEHFSLKMLENIDDILMKSSTNGCIDLGEGVEIVYEYGLFYIWDFSADYCYKLDGIEYIETPYFSLVSEGRTIEGMSLSPADFPLTIRPYMEGDAIELRYGHKKVSRFFIDRKILKKERHLWPVVVNAENEVIFVSGIGCDVYHFSIKPDVFMIK